MSRLLSAHGPGFGRGQVVQNLSWVDIEPLLEAVDFLLGKAADVTAFRNETANHPVQVLIAASFPRAVRVRVVDLGALPVALQTGAFQLRRAQKLAAVVHGDGPEGVPKPFGSEFPFDPIQRLHHAGLGLVRELADDRPTGFAFRQRQQARATASPAQHQFHRKRQTEGRSARVALR